MSKQQQTSEPRRGDDEAENRKRPFRAPAMLSTIGDYVVRFDQRGRRKAMFAQISSRIPWSLINWGSHKAPKYYSTRHNNIIPHLKIHVRDNLLRLAQDNQSLLIGKRGTAILPRKESPSMSVCLRQRDTVILPWKGSPSMSQRQSAVRFGIFTIETSCRWNRGRHR